MSALTIQTNGLPHRTKDPNIDGWCLLLTQARTLKCHCMFSSPPHVSTPSINYIPRVHTISTPDTMAPIKHIVQFQFKDSASHDQVRDVRFLLPSSQEETQNLNCSQETNQQACAHMLRLQEALHPETQQPYIKSISGGKDNSPEGLQVRSI